MKQYKIANEKGFTLSEVLVTMVLLLILGGLLVPALFHYRINLKQKELDTKAELIYMAVQNRLTQLYTSGNQDLYDPSLHSDMICLGYYPEDYNESLDYRLSADTLYYFRKGSDVSDAIVTDEVLDYSLNGPHSYWVIELVPYAYYDDPAESKKLTAATVYAVYYSEEPIDVSLEYSESEPYKRQYRSLNERRESGVSVGYYGGSHASSSALSQEG